MIESWRWFGPLDKITLPEVAQTGARGIVTALHEIPYGEVWTTDAIEQRKALIAEPDLGLEWVVVESLPVHEDIKRGEGKLDQLFANYRQSMANLAQAGIRTICYNFMPLLDWTRTTLNAPVAGGGTALRFSAVEMAAFEVITLGLDVPASTYSPAVMAEAEAWHTSADEATHETLLVSIMAGLPGAYDRYSIEGLKQALAGYQGIDRAQLRANYARFLNEVVPTAQELGMRLGVHPDDPPRDLLGLPRIVTGAEDIDFILSSFPATENGITLCSGSLGAHPDNDVPAIAKQFADRIHFAHLRNVAKEADGSFQEAAHLQGDVDMAALIDVLMTEDTQRQADGRPQFAFRPDHGHDLLDDAARRTHPGYPLVGRLRGLAELRGVIAGLAYKEGRNALNG